MKAKLSKIKTTRNSCPVYFYKHNDNRFTNKELKVSDILYLHNQLKHNVGIKNLHRNGFLTEKDEIVQFGNGYSKRDQGILKENELRSYMNMKVNRFDFHYSSLWNLLFMSSSSVLNKYFGYDENRGSTLIINYYPSIQNGKDKFTIDIKSSKKKNLQSAKKYLEEIL